MLWPRCCSSSEISLLSSGLSMRMHSGTWQQHPSHSCGTSKWFRVFHGKGLIESVSRLEIKLVYILEFWWKHALLDISRKGLIYRLNYFVFSATDLQTSYCCKTIKKDKSLDVFFSLFQILGRGLQLSPERESIWL